MISSCHFTLSSLGLLLFSQWFLTSISNMYAHWNVIMVSRMKEVASSNKGAKKKNTDNEKEIRGFKEAPDNLAISPS